ncbi:MAG: SDR family NAD(P)-dependent oxidoreductase [Pirellulales bacterium]
MKNKPRLEGKVAVVTGGSRGIGRATSIALAAQGAKVMVNYHCEADSSFDQSNAVDEVLDAIAKIGGTAVAQEADLAREEQARRLIDRAVQEYGGIDILVCNAGLCPSIDFLEMSMDAYDRVHDVNLRGHFICCQQAARHMIDSSRGGRIIAVSSISALVGGSYQTHYCSTKSGLHSLMQSLAIVLGPHGITCNSVGPGEVDTDMNNIIPNYDEIRKQLEDRIPLRRIAQPEDIADPIVFLASDDARYVSGAFLLIDGGMFVNLQ